MNIPVIPDDTFDFARYSRCIAAIDEENRKDPREADYRGALLPYEYAYSLHMTDWVLKLDSAVSERVLLAARGQHLSRWIVARNSYPSGLNGYLEWRESLKSMHAEKVSALMKASGYPLEDVQRVQALITKANFPDDPSSRTIEDALCLVFLDQQLESFIAGHERPKVIDVIQKTWQKMTPAAHDLALQLSYSEGAASIIHEALDA